MATTAQPEATQVAGRAGGANEGATSEGDADGSGGEGSRSEHGGGEGGTSEVHRLAGGRAADGKGGHA